MLSGLQNELRKAAAAAAAAAAGAGVRNTYCVPNNEFPLREQEKTVGEEANEVHELPQSEQTDSTNMKKRNALNICRSVSVWEGC